MEQVEKLMELLQCTEEQAKDIIACDKEIDKMTVAQCESDLSKDQKAFAKNLAKEFNGKISAYESKSLI